jgi:RNA polymerase sigma factor (TIGR02999 family)
MRDAPPPSLAEFARTLSQARSGDLQAAAVVFPLVYAELKRLAVGYLRNQPPGHILQPTALVHESYLRLCERTASYADRSHFTAVAATAMRQILIDYSRRHSARKRGGGARQVTLSDVGAGPSEQPLSPVDVLALDAALTRLAELSPRQARIVELQFFGGMTVDEVAEELQVSKSQVEREWRSARAWIRSALSEDPA